MAVDWTHDVPVGTTEPQDFALFNGASALDGAGLTVSLVFETEAGVAVDPAPTIAWLSQAGGTVRITGAGGLAVGRYYVRVKVTDGSGLVGFFPNDAAKWTWRVVPVP